MGPEEIASEIRRLTALVAICQAAGEADGQNAAQSQLRALRAHQAKAAD